MRGDDKIPLHRIERVRIGTTVATNALLERKGSKTALLITHGFGDLLEIGNQARPELFDLSITKPNQLYHSVSEIHERLDAEGNIVRELDEERVEKVLEDLYDSGIRSVAIVLMHSWKNPMHEERCYDLAKEVGFEDISISSRIMPLIKIVGRGQTTVVDSYLYPILNQYISSLQSELGAIPIEFMQSSGGLTDSLSLTGKDSIVSGPAGGVIGSAAVGNANNLDCIIGFDMGGTSTDVSRYDGSFSRVTELVAGGINFQTSSLDIKTVAAGGGSLLWFDGRKLQVGPESAGANPGPVCYGLDGKLTLTDANLLLGRINPDFFPQVFGPEQNQKLNASESKDNFENLRSEVNKSTLSSFSSEELALGFVDIANEKMAGAIKEISVSRGYDVRDHAHVSSSMPKNPQSLKNGVVEKALKRSDSKEPYDVIANVGDPMIPFVAGMLSTASEITNVILAGGTQMAAVLAIAKSTGYDENRVAIGTTSYIIDDKDANLLDMVKSISDIPVLSINPKLKNSKFDGLRAYSKGFVKEGVGAGGSMIASILKTGIDSKKLLELIDKEYSRVTTSQ